MKKSGFIFDLDGVIVDTAKYHYLAWSRLAKELGFGFTEEQNEALKGVSRSKAFEILLSFGEISLPENKRSYYLDRKNQWYLEMVDQMGTEEILPGVLPFLDKLKEKGYPVCLGSASKNAQRILSRLDITHYFHAVVDGNRVQKTKPDPEVFLLGAMDLGLSPEECMVFEDALAGIAAAKAAKMFAIGVGDKDVLVDADFVIPGFDVDSPDVLLETLLKLNKSTN